MRKMTRRNFLKGAAATMVSVGVLGACTGSNSGSSSSAPAAATTAAGEQKETEAAADTSNATYVMKIAHVNSQTHPAHLALMEFKKTVEAETKGDVVVDIYDSSVLGGELEEIEQVTDGSLTAAMVMGLSNWQNAVPETAIEELPFMYPDVAAARMAFDGEYGKYVKENWVEPTGLKVLCFWESGFRHFTNNVRPIVTPDDMKDIKFRSAQSEIRVKMFEALGATATVINFSELYTALQQGTVDGQENPLSIITANGFYDVQKYLSLSGHFYSTALFIVNPEFWASLPEDYQAIIQKAAEDNRDYERQLCSDLEGEMIQTCKDNGMEVNDIDKEPFKEKMDSVWALYTDNFGTDIVNLALTSSGQDAI